MSILEELYYGTVDLHIRRDQNAQLRKIQVLLIRDEEKMRAVAGR